MGEENVPIEKSLKLKEMAITLVRLETLHTILDLQREILDSEDSVYDKRIKYDILDEAKQRIINLRLEGEDEK